MYFDFLFKQQKLLEILFLSPQLELLHDLLVKEYQYHQFFFLHFF